MEIDKNKLAELASDCHHKQVKMQDLHKHMQKGGSAIQAADYAIAKVEYNRAKNLLDLEVRNQSVTLIKKAVHASDCALHNGPAMIPEPCDCGAEPGMTPEVYGSEYPSRESEVKVNKENV